MPPRTLSAVLAALGCLCAAAPAAALQTVVWRQQGRERSVEGRLVVEAQDGGLLLEARDGRLWRIAPDELVRRQADARPFVPLTKAEVADGLRAELPRGFDIHQTAHYVLVFSTSREYAQWCGALFEQLYKSFFAYWTHREFPLVEPEFPLVAIVFADRADFTRHAVAEAGAGAGSILGYYSVETNRITTFDLTGLETIRRLRDRRGGSLPMAQLLARPEAERTVATLVHEATHQIAFNCGLQRRLSDCPLWFSEGLALFFETPELGSGKGWRTVGNVNRVRLAGFKQSLASRPPDSLSTLVADDRRLRESTAAPAAYAEAWALTWFLVRQRPKQYVDYMRRMAAKPPLVWDEPARRLEEFQTVFGDLKLLDAELVRHVGRMP